MASVSLKLYTVTFDLTAPGDYGSLRERLRTLDARQVLPRQWALRTTYTAVELKEIFKGFIGEQDRVVVAEVGAERASRRALIDLTRL
jgi:hypothetical protein